MIKKGRGVIVALHYVLAAVALPASVWLLNDAGQRLIVGGFAVGLAVGGWMAHRRTKALPSGARAYPWVSLIAYAAVVGFVVWVFWTGGADPDGSRHGRYLVACGAAGLMLGGLPFAFVEILRVRPPTFGSHGPLWRPRPNE